MINKRRFYDYYNTCKTKYNNIWSCLSQAHLFSWRKSFSQARIKNVKLTEQIYFIKFKRRGYNNILNFDHKPEGRFLRTFDHKKFIFKIAFLRNPICKWQLVYQYAVIPWSLKYIPLPLTRYIKNYSAFRLNEHLTIINRIFAKFKKVFDITRSSYYKV